MQPDPMPKDTAQTPAFLNIDHSVTGRRWVGADLDTQRRADGLAQRHGLLPPVAAVLARLGVTEETVDPYLNPKLRDLLPDPRSLRDMEGAAARLVHAVQRKERIAIFADYDVDGGASAALLLDWVRALGRDATLYVPDRIDEGYGPNAPAMQTLADQHDLILCVDCGTLSHDAIAAARGADVVILDHHLGGETLPPALAVVNPNRQDEDGTLAHLCAAAVVFLCLVEANRQLREAGQSGPDLMGLLDLVALATVADVAPLVGVNRAFVRQGLSVMARRARPGLRALADVAQLDAAPTPYHLGYVLGPRINAGGRIGQADLGARLLSTPDMAQAMTLATQLDGLNADRRAVEQEVREAALAQVEARRTDAPLVWAAGEGWHPGVVGIVAARLKEATNRPAVVIGLDGAVGKGSGRSVHGIDLGAAIQRLAQEGLLQKGGGHKMAAGLTVAREGLTAAMDRLSDILARQGADQLGAADLRLDGVLEVPAATPDLIDQLDQAGPFGQGAPGPRFAFAHQTIRHVREVGQGHLKVAFGAPGTPNLDAIAFNAWSTPLGTALREAGPTAHHLAGRLERNEWGGRVRVQLKLEDAALPRE